MPEPRVRVLVRALCQAGFGLGPSSGRVTGCTVGTPCRSRVGLQGLGPSVGIVPGPGSCARSECTRRIGRGSGPSAEVVSGAQVQDQCGDGASAQGSVGASGVVLLGRGAPG